MGEFIKVGIIISKLFITIKKLIKLKKIKWLVQPKQVICLVLDAEERDKEPQFKYIIYNNL